MFDVPSLAKIFAVFLKSTIDIFFINYFNDHIALTISLHNWATE